MFTDEQNALIHAFASGEKVAGDAVAGSGKTTTAVAALNAAPARPTLTLAFNKRNADDLAAKIPSHCEARTFNALGHRVWSRHIGKNLILDTDKDFKLIDELNLPVEWDQKAPLKKMVEVAKNYGIPCGILQQPDPDISEWERRWDEHDGDTDVFQSLLPHALVLLKKSVAEGWKGRITFADQLYLPVLFNANFPRYEVVVADEAQDLSTLQHTMVERSVKNQLFIVGDPHQAIYAFRGASASSFDEMTERFSLKTLGLTYSFRCPSSIATLAKRWVPHFSVPPGAPEGIVTYPDHPEDRGTYICRFNAPLITQAFRLLRAIKPINFLGRDFLAGLIALHKKHPTKVALESWYKEKLDKSKTDGAKARAKDQFMSMCTLHDACAKNGQSLESVLKTLAAGSKDPRAITLSTIHKAKGMEWDEVTILDADLEKTGGQEENLLYVAVTRAKKRLNIIQREWK